MKSSEKVKCLCLVEAVRITSNRQQQSYNLNIYILWKWLYVFPNIDLIDSGEIETRALLLAKLSDCSHSLSRKVTVAYNSGHGFTMLNPLVCLLLLESCSNGVFVTNLSQT